MSRRILVVDDEQVIRDLVRRAFAGQDFGILEAANGDEALAILSPCGRGLG